jgi:hypothetical protein
MSGSKNDTANEDLNQESSKMRQQNLTAQENSHGNQDEAGVLAEPGFWWHDRHHGTWAAHQRA